jgi:uncharacterized protein with FMN-binding domain
MKRGLLIGVGALGGLGAVMSITPPNFGTSTGTGAAPLLNGTTKASNTTTPSQTPVTQPTPAAPATPSPTATKKATTKTKSTTSTTSTKSKKSTKKTTTQSNTTSQSSSTTPSTPAQSSSTAVSGTFTGDPVNTRFGPVQVQITVSNGRITSAKGLTYPMSSGTDQYINSQAIPLLIQETLQAQSANIQGVGGASYTSTGWYYSLQSALSKAGMK